VKRKAFEHEAEVRLSLYASSHRRQHPGVSLSIDPHALIEDVMIDPRAPQEVVGMYRYYLRTALKFTGSIRQSRLYGPAERLALRDG